MGHGPYVFFHFFAVHRNNHIFHILHCSGPIYSMSVFKRVVLALGVRDERSCEVRSIEVGVLRDDMDGLKGLVTITR